MDQRVLEVTVESARHLPKTDTFGCCDPYVTLDYGGNNKRTTIKKRVYMADWNESFTFPVLEQRASLMLDVYDWNMATTSEKVGTNYIPWDQISNLLSSPLGSEQVFALNLQRDGKIVVGNDKAITELHIRLRVLGGFINGHETHSSAEGSIRRRAG
jgi:Ca2+-dependent lipid-binding protein